MKTKSGKPKTENGKLSTVRSLALHGGPKACPAPWPPRKLFGKPEQRAVQALFEETLRTGQAFGYNGPQEEAYCKEFAGFLGGGFADAVNSGSSAVYVALRALEKPAFTEVVCGPITDAGGVMPVPLAGYIPVIADSEPGHLNPSPDSIEKRITRRTSAIIVTHLAGMPADMGPIMEIARAKGIAVIEDCAQAHGARYRGRYVGTFGDFGAFSTMFGKHHATGGQGGVVFTRNEELYWRARRYSDRGKPFHLTGTRGNVAAAHNMNLNDLSACIGRVSLRKLPRIVAARRRKALWMIRSVNATCKAVRLLEGRSGDAPSFWFLIGRLDLPRLATDLVGFTKALQAEGVVMEAPYLMPFVDQEWYTERRVFQGTGYPWTSPLYKGDPDRAYPIPNLRAAHKELFQLYWHEALPMPYLRNVLAAIRKVEAAFPRT